MARKITDQGLSIVDRKKLEPISKIDRTSKPITVVGGKILKIDRTSEPITVVDGKISKIDRTSEPIIIVDGKKMREGTVLSDFINDDLIKNEIKYIIKMKEGLFKSDLCNDEDYLKFAEKTIDSLIDEKIKVLKNMFKKTITSFQDPDRDQKKIGEEIRLRGSIETYGPFLTVGQMHTSVIDEVAEKLSLSKEEKKQIQDREKVAESRRSKKKKKKVKKVSRKKD